MVCVLVHGIRLISPTLHCRLIRRLGYWLELSLNQSGASPITSPSATQLGASTSAAPAPSSGPDQTAAPAPPAAGQSETEADSTSGVSHPGGSVLKSLLNAEDTATPGAGAAGSCHSDSVLLASGGESESRDGKTSRDSGFASRAASTASQDTTNLATTSAPSAVANEIQSSSGAETHVTFSANESGAGAGMSATCFPAAPGPALWRPEFPLLPASRGFCLSMQKTLPNFSAVLRRHGISPPRDA